MTYDKKKRREIYDRTRGYCHICRAKMYFTNYGRADGRGGWEVEHSNPRANGGTDRLRNLYGAHIPCNRNKGVRSTKSARAEHGYSRAPLTYEKYEAAKTGNALGGALVGAAIGARFGPHGLLFGGIIGAILGTEIDPDDE